MGQEAGPCASWLGAVFWDHCTSSGEGLGERDDTLFRSALTSDSRHAEDPSSHTALTSARV